MKRTLVTLAAIASLALGLALSASPAEAAGTITPWQSQVAVGATFSATANGCPFTEDEGDTSYTVQRPELRVVVGSGAGRRSATFGRLVEGARQRFNLPGWVDPDEPATIEGSCRRITYEYETDTETDEVLFTYPAAAIDIVAGSPAAAGPLQSLSRTTAAGGQAIRVEISGCDTSNYVTVAVLDTDDPTLAGPLTFVAGDSGDLSGGAATVDVALNTLRGEGGGPLPEGTYAVVTLCVSETQDDYLELYSSPQLITVVGSNPSGDLSLDVVDDQVMVTGAGCTGGRDVTVRLEVESFEISPAASVRKAGAAAARGDLVGAAAAARPIDGALPGLESGDTVVTPEADGRWTATFPIAENDLYVSVTAACGDPLADGFAYAAGSAYLGGPSADVYADRVSPTSSPTDGEVTTWISGECETGASAALYRGKDLVAASSSTVVPGYGVGKPVTLTAPSTPGTYELVSMCDGGQGGVEEYEVFAATTVSGTAPLAAQPSSGWPEQGRREVYEGRIGPIDLPAMGMDEEPISATRALGPSGLFIDIPRPEGDFAITKIDMNLVDAEGMPVDATAAHLHHFVITNASSKNPACPGGSTFGLPGEIIGAAGAEKTVLNMGDPYGIVVDADDDWTGVYELMSRSMEDQEVFLTYDITYRRDVQNVRPVTRYFGSATGCSTFTWTIDGSGAPDTQTTYIDIAKSGRLVGGGAHIHNGGMHADLTNDRDRRLCRSEITYGTEPVGHGMPMLRRAMDDTTATTMVEPTPTDEYPPEFYDDDLAIDAISTCGLAEQVTAGERIRFDAVYENDRPRSGVMGIFSLFVWEGGGPAAPANGGAQPIPGSPDYTG